MPERELNIDHLATVRDKIKAGMDSIRVGRTVSPEQVNIEMTAFKKRHPTGNGKA